MPELPEVETIRMGLEKYLVGDAFLAIDVRLPKMFAGDPDLILDTVIDGVRRFGKGLVIDFVNGYSLAIHIKMTGQLVYVGPRLPAGVRISEKVGGCLPNKHTHVIFQLRAKGPFGKLRVNREQREDAYLYYNDIRQFGWMKIVRTAELSSIPFFKELGPEPFRDLDLSYFRKLLQSRKSPIKPLLLDQKKIGGVGNIYANDALFLAKIHPTRPANSLSDEEVERLYESLERVLRKGLEVGGASEWQYVNAEGQTGKYQNFFQVYGKVGKPCVRCGALIEKSVMGGRGTFFCSKCQV
jgi:formamidopyrimidine-DNA glycosylase